MKVLYQEMFPDEFKAAMAQNPLAFLPLGAMEFHGWHNALGLDSLKANRLCELAAQQCGGIVLSTLSIGFDLFPKADSQKHPNKQYDIYHVDGRTYQELLEQYFADIFNRGFKKLFVLCGHYPNKDIALLASGSKKLKNHQIWALTEADLLNYPGDHAGKFETSLMMALFPSFVDLNKANLQENKLLAVSGNPPSQATAEYGQECIQKIILAIEYLIK